MEVFPPILTDCGVWVRKRRMQLQRGALTGSWVRGCLNGNPLSQGQGPAISTSRTCLCRATYNVQPSMSDPFSAGMQVARCSNSCRCRLDQGRAAIVTLSGTGSSGSWLVRAELEAAVLERINWCYNVCDSVHLMLHQRADRLSNPPLTIYLHLLILFVSTSNLIKAPIKLYK